jgi:hypothetical protein
MVKLLLIYGLWEKKNFTKYKVFMIDSYVVYILVGSNQRFRHRAMLYSL